MAETHKPPQDFTLRLRRYSPCTQAFERFGEQRGSKLSEARLQLTIGLLGTDGGRPP